MSETVTLPEVRDDVVVEVAAGEMFVWGQRIYHEGDVLSIPRGAAAYQERLGRVAVVGP